MPFQRCGCGRGVPQSSGQGQKPMRAVDPPLASDTDKREPATRCPKCRQKTVRLRARPGRTVHFRNMKALSVPDGIPIPTCSRCSGEYIDPETAARLDVALLEAYRDALRRRVRRAIDLVTEHISQRRLELLLGLSQGYLSRLRAGNGNPHTIRPLACSSLRDSGRTPRASLSICSRQTEPQSAALCAAASYPALSR